MHAEIEGTFRTARKKNGPCAGSQATQAHANAAPLNSAARKILQIIDSEMDTEECFRGGEPWGNVESGVSQC
jgi:hypothetical protein